LTFEQSAFSPSQVQLFDGVNMLHDCRLLGPPRSAHNPFLRCIKRRTTIAHQQPDKIPRIIRKSLDDKVSNSHNAWQ
jgi:hypothetical protein